MVSFTAMMLCAMRLESLELFAMLLDHGAQDKVHIEALAANIIFVAIFLYYSQFSRTGNHVLCGLLFIQIYQLFF
jgi:hypothetical protein